MPGNSRVSFFSDDDISLMKDKLFILLETRGFKMEHPLLLKLLDKAGAIVDFNTGIVRLPKSFLEEKLQLGSELKNAQNLKAMALDDGVNYDSKAKPLFVGHYWLKDEIPKPLSGNSVCVDYSIAKSGKLVAYQWQGEEVLNESQFVW